MKRYIIALSIASLGAEAKRNQLAGLKQRGGLNKLEALMRRDVFTPPPG